MFTASGMEYDSYPLSRTQVKALCNLLFSKSSLYKALVHVCDEGAAVLDARIEFQRDRSIKLERRAVTAVRRLGWMNTKRDMRLRGKRLLEAYWVLTTNHAAYAISEYDEQGCYLSNLPNPTHIPGSPLAIERSSRR